VRRRFHQFTRPPELHFEKLNSSGLICTILSSSSTVTGGSELLGLNRLLLTGMGTVSSGGPGGVSIYRLKRHGRPDKIPKHLGETEDGLAKWRTVRREKAAIIGRGDYCLGTPGEIQKAPDYRCIRTEGAVEDFSQAIQS